MKSLGYIGAFLGGAVAGAVIGLLVAPESGKDTRTKVTDTVNDFLKKHNIKWLITNPQLADNVKVQNMFNKYDHTQYMLRRSYIKHID